MATLSIDGMSVGYGAKRVLSDVTLPPLEAGRVVGVLGPNGVGKSTFLRALAGFLRHGGEIHLNGERLQAMTHRRRAGLIGYLPQMLPQVTTLIAYEAVVSACRAVRPDLPTATVDAAVEEVFERLGIGHLAFQALNKLSGGQRQMVGLAQVIVRKPAVLLLDEPTSALDLRWQLGVFKVVRDAIAEQGGICLMALHDINLAMRHCDDLLLFSDNRVLAFGSPSMAMTSNTLRRAYGVEGRIEVCTQGKPFVITDGVCR